MTDLIIIAVLAAVIVPAAVYIYRARKSGARCIGCPSGGCCHASGETAGGCGCCGSAHK